MRVAYLGWAHSIHLQRWAGFFARQQNRYKVHVWSLSPTRSRIDGARTSRLLMRRHTRLLVQELRMRSALFNPDLVHVHWAEFAPLVFLTRRRPFGVTVWGSDVYLLDSEDKSLKARTIEALQWADFVTCDSRDLRAALIAMGVNPEKIHIVQWGVDTDLFHPGANGKALRRELGIVDGQRVIFSPRQVKTIYGIEVVLDAFRKTLNAYPNTVLVQKCHLASEEELEHIQRVAVSLGVDRQVKWVGEIEYQRMPDLYSMADVVVSVPESDGTPVSVLEAMAAGKPVVVSDVPSVTESVQDQVNGQVVPVGCARSLAAALCELLESHDKREEMGLRNRNFVTKQASHTTHMRYVSELYELVTSQYKSRN